LAVGKIGAKFFKFFKFTASISLAAVTERFFAADSPLIFGGGTFAQRLPGGGCGGKDFPRSLPMPSSVPVAAAVAERCDAAILAIKA
jgi:hypothetical protein